MVRSSRFAIFASLLLLWAMQGQLAPLTQGSLHQAIHGPNEDGQNGNEWDLQPVGGYDLQMLNETRRKLGSFQVCALCKCCGGLGSKRLCLPSPCCYTIDCNIPNRPFGFCAFTPKACNCFGCHL